LQLLAPLPGGEGLGEGFPSSQARRAPTPPPPNGGGADQL